MVIFNPSMPLRLIELNLFYSQKNIDNDMGNKNNLVSVRQSDFEVFQALAKDIEEGNNNEEREYTQVGILLFFVITTTLIWRLIN